MLGNQERGTYFASAMGFGTIDVGQRATAVTGYLQGVCDAWRGQRLRDAAHHHPRERGHVRRTEPAAQHEQRRGRDTWFTRSRCAATAPATSAGSTGLRPAAVRASSPAAIENPNNPPFDLPSWQYVDAARQRQRRWRDLRRRVTSTRWRTRFGEYNGQIVYIPMFDVMCGDEPDHSQVELPSNYGCPAERARRRQRQQPVVSVPEPRLLRAVRPQHPRVQRVARRLHAGQQPG